MAKLIQILAASLGGGLVLGASIRLGEAIGASVREAEREQRAKSARRTVSVPSDTARFDAAPSGSAWQAAITHVIERMDRQQAEVETIRHQVSRAARVLDSAGETAGSLRDDLQRQLGEDLDRRLAAVEEKLYLSMKAANRETVNAMLASIETRVAPRISRLESEIGDQSAAVAELRDCSLKSERSIQRLLTVLERTLNPRAGEAGTEQGSVVGPGDLSRGDSHKLSVVTGRGQ